MRPINITTLDFTPVPVDPKGELFYWSYRASENVEVCLEPCLSGYCIGIYDKQENLLIPKECTNLDHFVSKEERTYELLEQAAVIAKRLYNQLLSLTPKEKHGN